ncbi:unnamed protein product [Sphagnum jensenii]|uniref:Uncharacterized protein n=1 Tax=Sphagnum jensenii TaxID=128206 RepID=A0ABP0V8E6_9BRYO
MSFTKKFSGAAIFLILICGNAYADRIFVEPATGAGIPDSDLQNATTLISTAVSDVSRNEVVSDPGQADFVLRPKLMKLGQAYVLALAKVRNNQIINSSQLKAERLDELDKVAERLTRSVLESQKASTSPRVGEITDQEARDGAQRRPVHKATYLGFGGSNFLHLNSTGIGYSIGAAYSWDVNYARVKILGEGDFNGGAFFLNAGIGGNYYLGMGDVAPYISADFGAGIAKLDEGVLDGQTVGGFVVGVGAGVEMLRTSSVNLDLGFRAGFLLHSNALGTPESLSLRLGLYF